MTDLEMTRLCAEAMGYQQRRIHMSDGTVFVIPHHADQQCAPSDIRYDPLKDDAQAMAIVKKIPVGIDLLPDQIGFITWCGTISFRQFESNADLNRAIVECVAKMQAAKK